MANGNSVSSSALSRYDQECPAERRGVVINESGRWMRISTQTVSGNYRIASLIPGRWRVDLAHGSIAAVELAVTVRRTVDLTVAKSCHRGAIVSIFAQSCNLTWSAQIWMYLDAGVRY